MTAPRTEKNAAATEGTYLVGIDIGGTCTDCVIVDQSGRVTLSKAFSTPEDFSVGIIDALEVAAAEIGSPLDEMLAHTRLFLHSTTVAENAVVNSDLASTGLVVTKGFEQTLFSTRGGYGRWSGLTEDEKRNPIYTDKPPPLLPPDRLIGIKERTLSDGSVLVEASATEVRAAVEKLLRAGAETLGVCLLWSFVNDHNEQIVRSVIEELTDDGALVTLSSEIAPVIGEYERMSTVALNAGLGPAVGRYLSRLQARLAEHGFGGALLVMQAYGGLLPVDRAVELPAGLIESGPVAGLVGCANLGRTLGAEDIISADLGGTTFKVGIVRGGLIDYQREPRVVRRHYALSKMDIESLGLAGGSIVSVDEELGTPQIGPQSAGAYPGPVCYGHGGTAPTVTDVDAALGYLNSDHFLAGRSALDIAAARAAVEEQVAAPLGLPVDEAAAGIYELTNSRIHDMLHKATVQRGLDPRRFSLFSTGGTAGMHLPQVGRKLEVREVIVPNTAAVQGAFGLVTSDVVHEELVTSPMRAPVDASEVDEILGDLRTRLVEQLTSEGFGGDEIEVGWSVDMRYRRQVHILTTPIEADPPPHRGGRVTGPVLDRLLDRFERLYTERYGPESAYREAGIELVTFRARGSGLVQRPALEAAELSGQGGEPEPLESRSVYVPETGEFELVSGFLFDSLGTGSAVHGPAVVWTPITTVVIPPDQVARLDAYRNLRISTGAEPA